VASAGSHGGRLRLVAVVALVLLFAALVAFGVLTYLKYRDKGDSRGDRTAAVAAARLEAVNLTTIDYKSTDVAVDRILAGATGTLASQFKAQRAQLGPLLTGTKSVSVGSVLEAGLVKLDGNNAEVLVAVDATVTTQPAGATKAQRAVKHYRMSMKLQRGGGRWLVSDVGFTGLAT
jgi:Mce-associated membrane protein